MLPIFLATPTTHLFCLGGALRVKLLQSVDNCTYSSYPSSIGVMTPSFEPLSRTTSGESSRSQASLRLLQRAPSSQHKSRNVEIDPSGGDVDRASISMPPPALKPKLHQHRLSSQFIGATEASIHNFVSGQQDEAMLPSPSLCSQPEDLERGMPSVGGLPEGTTARRSDPELETNMNRLSFSSLYNLGKSAASSVAGGSDQDGVHSHV